MLSTSVKEISETAKSSDAPNNNQEDPAAQTRLQAIPPPLYTETTLEQVRFYSKETEQPADVEVTSEPTQTPPAETSPSPPLETSPSPLFETSPSPPLETSPSPLFETSPSPPLETSPSPPFDDFEHHTSCNVRQAQDRLPDDSVDIRHRRTTRPPN